MQTLNSPKQWYAVYTKSRAEKKLYSLLIEKGIECYLPLKKELRQWSNRKKWVETPLINSYLFVKSDTREYFEILNTAGAVCYVTFNGKAAAIPQVQIETLQLFLEKSNQSVQLTREKLAYGDQVEVLSGSLKGVQGEIIQFRGKHRIVLRFESLGCCVHTDISLNEVKGISMSRQANV